MGIREHTPTFIVRMVEYGSCPGCGDRLRKNVCDNRAGQCGKDWTAEYKVAKQELADGQNSIGQDGTK